MAIILGDNIMAGTTKPADAKYGPYRGATLTDCIEASFGTPFQAPANVNPDGTNAFTLDPGRRYSGLTVGYIINNAPVKEYWIPVDKTFPTAFVITDLVEKGGGSGGAITLSQTGADISTAIQKIDVNQPAGSGLLAQAKNMTGTLIPTTGITVNLVTNPQGIFTGLTTTVAPVGGSGATLSVTVKSGNVVSVRIDAAGSGYSVGDVLTVAASDIGTGGSTDTSITLVAADIYNGSLAPVSTTLNTIYDTQLSPTQQSVGVQVGGIAPSTPVSDLLGLNLVEIIDKILFPTVPPNYSAPSAAMGASVAGTKEIGFSVSQALTTTLTRNDAGEFTSQEYLENNVVINTGVPTSAEVQTPVIGNDGGAGPASTPGQFGFPSTNRPPAVYSGYPGNISNRNFQYSRAHTVPTFSIGAPTGGSMTSVYVYRSRGYYNDGLAKLDSAGGLDTRAVGSSGGPIGSGNKLSNTITITGIYPYFYGTTEFSHTATEIQTIINNNGSGNPNGTFFPVLAQGQGTLTWNFGMSVGNEAFGWFAIPVGYNVKTSWADTQNVSNTGAIGGVQGGVGNGNQLMAPISKLISSPTGGFFPSSPATWSNVAYNIYGSNTSPYEANTPWNFIP